MCVHCRTQFFIKEFSAAMRTLPVRHHGHLKKWSSNFLVFFVVLVVIELSEKNNAHVQFGHEGRPNLVSWGETSIYANCLVLFAHLLLPLLHHPFGAAARRVRPLGPWQAGASLVQLALLHLPECGSLFLTSCCGTSLSCSLCVSERLPIIKKVQVLAEEEEEVARRDSDMSIDDSDFL